MEELSEKEILEREVMELDAFNVELWADDPDVVFVDAPLDANAVHGSNTVAEMDV